MEGELLDRCGHSVAFSTCTMIVCCAVPKASGVHRSEVSTLTDPRRSTPLLVGRPPGPLRNVDHARQDAIRHPAGQDRRPTVVEDLDLVSIGDAARLGVQLVEKHPLREGLLKPVHVVVCRVHPAHIVMPHRLERVFLCLRPEGAFPFLDIFGYRRDLFRPVHVVQLLGENLDLARRRIQRIARPGRRENQQRLSPARPPAPRTHRCCWLRTRPGRGCPGKRVSR